MLQIAHRRFALHVVTLQPRNGLHRLGRHACDTREQQIGLFGVVLLLWEFVDVEQHGAHNVEIPFRRIARPLAQQGQQRLQHGRQRRVFVADDAKGLEFHGACLLIVVTLSIAATGIFVIDAGQVQVGGRQRLSSSALPNTLTELSAMAAPATTGLR